MRSVQFNGRAERFFKTFRIWQRVTLFAWRIPSIQRKLDIYRDWFNGERAIFGLGCRTPNELWAGAYTKPTAGILPACQSEALIYL